MNEKTREDFYDYRPINALPYWEIIGPFVEACVADAANGDRTRRTIYPAIVPFVLWCWRTRAMPLERRRIFRRSVADDFVHRGMPGYLRGSRATHRASLYRVIEALGADEPMHHRRPIPRSDPTRPYSQRDVAALHSWAVAQGTERRRLDAITLLVLGLGAGLTTREILGTQSKDIITTTNGFSVSVWDGRPRVVPINSLWSDRLERIYVGLDPEAWAFRPGRLSNQSGQLTDFLQRARTSLDIRPARMRTTWLIEHLAIGTPPADLLRISGLQTLAALDRLTSFVPSSGHVC